MGDIYSEVLGNGEEVVLLVHGTGCSLDWWPDPLVDGLVAAGYRVVCYDHRDTGASAYDPPGRPSYTLRDLRDDALGVLDAYGVNRAHWVGVSMGGWIAQLAALDAPETVASLTLVSSRASGHGPAVDGLPDPSPELLAAWEAQGEPDWADGEALLDWLVESNRVLASPHRPYDAAADRETWRRVLARTTDLGSTLQNHQVADQEEPWHERLADVAAPTLVVHGEDDPLFPVAHAHDLARRIPGAELALLPGVGHELPTRAVAALLPRLLDHLEEASRDRRAAGAR